jgi:hypothetical protein
LSCDSFSILPGQRVRRVGDDAQARLVLRLLLDPGHHGPAGGGGLLRGRVGRDGLVDAGRDVLDGLQDVELEVGTFQLVCPTFGVKAVALIVLVLGREFLDRVAADVVVGHHQAVGGDEARRTSRPEAHGRFLEVFEPGGGRLEAVALLQELGGRGVEQPHALIGPGRAGQEQ